MATKQNNVVNLAPQEGKQRKAFDTKVDVMIYGGAAGCVDKDTEFLSEHGWKKISDYKIGDKVLQFDPDTDQSVFVEPLEYIKLPCDYLTIFQGKAVDQCLSDEHRVLYYNENGAYHTKPFSTIKERHLKSKTKGFTGKFKTTFEYDGVGLDLSEGDLRLQVAVMADGRVVKEGKDNYTQMRFSKKRKYDRLISLCKEYGLKYKDNGSRFNSKYSNDTEYEVIVWPKLNDKEFDSKYFKCSKRQLEIIFDEVFYWDGSFVKNEKTTTSRYFTKHKCNADFIQFVSLSCGYNSTISEDTREGKHTYTVNCMSSGKGFRGIANKDGKIPMNSYKTLDGFKYCFSVPSSYFVMRRNDKVCITGNSGKSRLLLIKALKHAYQDPNFEGVMFRRTTGPLKGAGGLFTESKKLFRPLNPRIREKDMEIIFEGTGGGNIKYTHLEHEDTAEANHQGLNCSPYIK